MSSKHTCCTACFCKFVTANGSNSVVKTKISSQAFQGFHYNSICKLNIYFHPMQLRITRIKVKRVFQFLVSNLRQLGPAFSQQSALYGTLYAQSTTPTDLNYTVSMRITESVASCEVKEIRHTKIRATYIDLGSCPARQSTGTKSWCDTALVLHRVPLTTCRSPNTL